MKVVLLGIFSILIASCAVLHPVEYNSPMKSVAGATPFKAPDCGLIVHYFEGASGYSDDFHAVFKEKGYSETITTDSKPSFQLDITARNLPDEKKNWARIALRRVDIKVFQQTWKTNEAEKEDPDESTVDRHGLVARVLHKIPTCTEAWKLGEGTVE